MVVLILFTFVIVVFVVVDVVHCQRTVRLRNPLMMGIVLLVLPRTEDIQDIQVSLRDRRATNQETLLIRWHCYNFLYAGTQAL